MAGSHRRAKDEPESDLYERWMTSRKEEPEPASEPASGLTVGPSTNVEFEPRTAARRLVGWLVLLAASGLVAAAIIAYREPTTLTVGLAATLFVLTLALWAIRAASPVARLSVRAGQLEVLQAGGRFVFELTGASFTPIEIVGAPGDRNWKVLFLRRNMDPFVIDSSMVDPHAFMEVLRRYRPE
jgi:hypothetical protein